MKKLRLIRIMLLVFFWMPVTGCSDSGAPNSYSWYRNTPVWELAKAVRSNDTAKMREIASQEGVDVNFQEPHYGQTLLMTAIANKHTIFRGIKTPTIRTLLELGADPNIFSYSEMGQNAVLVSCEVNYPEALDLLLKYGGDPEAPACRTGKWANDYTPLIAAALTFFDSSDTRCLELLLRAGADVNQPTPITGETPAMASKAVGHYKQLLFFLENGASLEDSFPSVVYRDSNGTRKLVTLLESLRESTPPLDSETFQYKRKVIEYLKTRGLDYDTVPIPEPVISWIQKKYPDSWQDYLKKY
ncbi:MAG: ankyrin repeat domain-containing protein [Bacteroidales bacterium]|nr:ankyrin repeat domain-containing protein [Bacteroidales bacterium]